jgi:hypothetical protein
VSKVCNEFDQEHRGSAEAPYKVGDKKPPLHSRFKPGAVRQSEGTVQGQFRFRCRIDEGIAQAGRRQNKWQPRQDS